MKVNVFRQDDTPNKDFPALSALKSAVTAALRGAKSKGEVCVIFVDNAQITRLNRRFLGKNRATDVIAFSYPDGPLGDIYVSADRAATQAAQMGHGVKKELFLLAVHGALHLAGMDDDTPSKRARMHAEAEKIYKRLYDKS